MISAAVNSLSPVLASSGKSSYGSPVSSGDFCAAASASSPESSPQLVMTTSLLGLSPLCVRRFSISRTTDLPLRTSPKTTCLPSRCGVGTVVIKNWEPFVPVVDVLVKTHYAENWGSIPGPAFAIDNKNGFECFRLKFSSSNFVP